MVNRTHRKVLWVMVLAGGALLACVSERGIQPEPEKYRLYVSTVSWNNRVYVVDTESDSLIDSTAATDGSTTRGLVTPDGKYLFRYSFPLCMEILDAATLTKVRDLPGCSRSLAFALEDSLILGTTSGRIDYLSYPDLELIGGDSIVLEDDPTISRPTVSTADDLLYVRLLYGGDHVERSELMALGLSPPGGA